LRKASPAVVLIAIFAVSIFLQLDPVSNNQNGSNFYVGVEFAYSHNLNDSNVILSDLKAMVDKVQTCTNLFVVGIPEVGLNQTLLDESCAYINNANLSFIIFYTDTTKYDYDLREWTNNAQITYGDKFLGVYRIDEPGGKELDNATFNGKPDRFLDPNAFDQNVKNYADAAELFVNVLGVHLDLLSERLYPKIFTSDYGLYWFDYKAGYEAVFAEFVWNHSRQIPISLCRGAAVANNRDWGVIITWMYDTPPYIESGQQLYADLTLAYDAGAKYALIFNYPNASQYGILTEEHFEALQDFWTYIHENPQKHGSNKGTVAYVLPEGYGFGFRNPGDNIWGVWSADDLASKGWNDTNMLLTHYGSNLDIIFDDPAYTNAVGNGYEKLYFWNQTISATS
jgi:hypothetical protein